MYQMCLKIDSQHIIDYPSVIYTFCVVTVQKKNCKQNLFWNKSCYVRLMLGVYLVVNICIGHTVHINPSYFIYSWMRLGIY